jgi:hypothetical protein
LTFLVRIKLYEKKLTFLEKVDVFRKISTFSYLPKNFFTSGGSYRVRVRIRIRILSLTFSYLPKNFFLRRIVSRSRSHSHSHSFPYFRIPLPYREGLGVGYKVAEKTKSFYKRLRKQSSNKKLLAL